MTENEKPGPDGAAAEKAGPSALGLADKPEARVVEVAGRTYRLRRLGWDETLWLAGILEEARVRRGLKLEPESFLATNVMETGATIFLAVLAKNREGLIEWVAHLLGLSADELRDAERFPPTSVLQILRQIVALPEVQAFFAGWFGERSEPAASETP